MYGIIFCYDVFNILENYPHLIISSLRPGSYMLVLFFTVPLCLLPAEFCPYSGCLLVPHHLNPHFFRSLSELFSYFPKNSPFLRFPWILTFLTLQTFWALTRTVFRKGKKCEIRYWNIRKLQEWTERREIQLRFRRNLI